MSTLVNGRRGAAHLALSVLGALALLALLALSAAAPALARVQFRVLPQP
jgi:hypothetical protein